ncbi:MAG: DUF928 domain-containing protein [Gammaproteobacteria bacterium]|nr:DUF928 domain-containing protein [Gammaproteobacteria bacterium]
MNSRVFTSIRAAAALLLLAVVLAPGSMATEAGKSAQGASMPVYKPPLRGATAAGRIGGGTRGKGERAFTLAVLAPDHTGLTVSAQPTLYWFVSERVTRPVELTLVDDRGSAPVLELALEPPIEPGIHAVRLAEHGVELEPLVPYEWFVALVVDAAQRSNDIVAGAEIQRVSAPEDLLARVSAADEGARPGLYARAGYWYDALDGLSAQIGQSTPSGGPRAQRAALLEQVGLSTAAAYDRTERP